MLSLLLTIKGIQEVIQFKDLLPGSAVGHKSPMPSAAQVSGALRFSIGLLDSRAGKDEPRLLQELVNVWSKRREGTPAISDARVGGLPALILSLSRSQLGIRSLVHPEKNSCSGLLWSLSPRVQQRSSHCGSHCSLLTGGAWPAFPKSLHLGTFP